MQYSFTDRIRKVLAMAREEAFRVSNAFVSPEHMLLGLLREGEGVSAAVLLNLNVDFDELRGELEDGLRRYPPVASALGELPYTSSAKKVLEYAMQASRERNDDYIGTEHLLLGLVSMSDGLAANALRSCGVTRERVKEELEWLLENSSSSTEIQFSVDTVSAVWPSLTELQEAAARLTAHKSSIAIVADLDVTPPTMLVEMMAALDGLHRALGGNGLILDRENVGAVRANEGALA